MKRILCLVIFASMTALAQQGGTSPTEKVIEAVKPIKPWQHQLNITVDGVFPMGTLAKTLSGGFGFDAIYYYHVFSHYQFVSFGIGYHSMGYKVNDDYGFSYLPIQVGYRYNFEIRDVQPYLGFELGAYFQKATDMTVIVQTSERPSTSDVFFGLDPKAGVRIPLDRTVDLDFCLKYHLVFTNPDLSHYMSAGFGVSYRFDTND